MGKEIQILYSSGQKKPKDFIIKNRYRNWVRDLIVKHSEKEDDVTEIVLYFDPATGDVTQVLFLDSGLDTNEDGFSSNLDFEGQIRDLYGKIKKQESMIKKLTHEKNVLEKRLAQSKRKRGRPRKDETS